MKTWGIGYEKSKRRAKDIYTKIGRIKCPALGNDYISFSRSGFNHLVRKGRIPRTRNEQKRRFVLVPHIEKIVKNPEAKIFYKQEIVKYKTNRHGEDVLIESKADFWAFVENIKSCSVKVIIRQLNGRDKHFFSVMGDKVEINSKSKKNKKSPKK